MRRRPIATWTRGMPGIKALGKLFFEKNFVTESVACVPALSVNWGRPPSVLIVRRIIRPKSRWWSKYLVAVDHSAAVPARKDSFFVRRDDRSAARGQSKNQSSIRGDTDHPTAHRTDTALWPVFGQTLSPPRAS